MVFHWYTMKDQPSLRDRAYRHIHEKVQAGSLAPGSQVSDRALAREIGISRTPVREAIRKLEHEGVLETVPRFGTIIRAPDRREIEELYELREALESYAVGCAAERRMTDDLETLQKLLDEIGAVAGELRASGREALEGALLRRFLAADMGFHLRLIEAAGNRRVRKVLVESRVLTGIFGTRRQEHTAAVLQETYRSHARILSAVRRGAAGEARRLTAEHIRASRREALEHLRRAESREGEPAMPAKLREELDRIERGAPPRKERR
jgi:DNA-binding GntR family transcriptional regulator